MFDSDKYFLDQGTFSESVDRSNSEQERYIIDQLLDEIWEKYDVDRSGDLDKEETKAMLMEIAADKGLTYRPEKFDSTFAMMDHDKSGTLDKHEMKLCL